MLTDIFEFINPIGNIIGGISTIVVVIEIIVKCHSFFTEKRYIKTALNFKRNSCLVSQAIYPNSLISSVKVVTYNSVLSFQMVNEMLNKVNYIIKPFKESYEGENIIHIGGPAANIHVNALFAEKLKKMCFCTPCIDEATHQKLELNESCIKYSNDDTRYFKIGDRFLEINESTRDYGIFIRIPYNKHEGIDYTTHIIFGCWSDGTLKAFEFFTKNYKMIAKRYRKSKYCFAIPINRIDNSIALITDNDIIDMTDDFFDK